MKGTKELILKTAKKLFGRNGIQKTSMDDIAREADIGKGTIYHYYESKEDLFIEVCEKEVDTLRAMLETAFDSVEGPEEKLKAYVMARCKMMGEIAKVFNLFKEEYLQYYSYVRKVQDKFTSFEQAKIMKALGDGATAGIFVSMDKEFVAYVLGMAIHSMELYFATQADSEDVEKNAEVFADIFINGLKKR